MKYINFILLLSLISCVQQQVKIGVVLTLSGKQSTVGKEMLNGIELAIDEWNEKGGALGKKVLLVVRDDKGDSTEAKSIANEIVGEGVIGIIGHMNSDCSIAASNIYEKSGLLMITPSSTHPLLTEQNLKNVFRVCGRDDAQIDIAINFLKDVLKSKKVFLIDDQSLYGKNLTEVLKKALTEKIKIVGEAQIDSQDSIFTDVINKIKELSPDLIYYGGYDIGGGKLIKQIRKQGITSYFFGADGLASDRYLSIAGKAAENSYFTFGVAVEDLGSASHFVRFYIARHGKVHDYAAYAYDAINILLLSYCKGNGSVTPDIIRANSFDGALGLISFDKKGDIAKAPYMIWVVKNNKFIPWTQIVK